MFNWILRAIASILLTFGFYVAIALLLFHFSLRAMLNDEFYAESLAEQDVYQRFYTDVLTPENMQQIWQEVSGDARILTSEELRDLLQTVAPPEYLQAQAEENLALLSSFAAGESEDLELYVEMAGPLDRTVTSLVDLIEVRIDETPVLFSQQIQSEAAQAIEADYSEDIALSLKSLMSASYALSSITDLTGSSEEEVLAIFDQAVATVLAEPSVDQRFRDALEEARPELRQAFKSGNTRDLLKKATRTAVAPPLEIALEDFKTRLDEQGRLALVPILANEVLGIEEAQFQAKADSWRQRLDSLLTRTLTIALVALAISFSLLTAINWGKPGNSMRWLYRVLISSGGASLALLTIAYFALPNAFDRIVGGLSMNQEVEVKGIVELVMDIVISLITSRLTSLMWIAGAALLLGVGIWAAMLAWERSRRRHEEEKPTGTESVIDSYPENADNPA
ncbi:MAG: hypothetical protein F4X65_00665 [Chloroflexi bacterium]|nr:hypothetical protein [Chloroflexota bacterium]